MKKIDGIDKVLKLVKYPSEIKKSQRPLTAYIHYNANEHRALLNYPLIYILQNQFQDKRYYHHLIINIFSPDVNFVNILFRT